MIAVGELQEYRVVLESLVPGAGERKTLVHFYYGQGPGGDGGPVLAKIPLRYSLAASTDIYGEYLFDEMGKRCSTTQRPMVPPTARQDST